jgi:TP901 family phage tail tape measure protein
VYNEDVSIDFSANVAPFSASLSQAIKGLENMSASADSTVAKIGKLDNVALAAVKTFGKFLDLNKSSTIQAAAYQQKLAGLATVTALNEKQFKGLSDVSLKFTREFPIGLDKSIGLIDTLRTSGVTTTKSIKELGGAFIKIQAASGEWGSEFVSDMLSVNRSFGGSQSSAIKFGDSLVSVSNKFGASASSVVGFTKALAPVASAMGLNATQTMGFSTAFARLGEDGNRSANALAKVMSDLTNSAKTGSPQIGEYAHAMNMSVDSLKSLVDTDPAEAVIRFTEAIAKQGPKAIDTLNRLGIDGVQSFKSIQALGKSKDIREILQTSADSFGNKSATEGAKEAFGGVNDQMTRLGDTMNQTVAAAGTPFLNMIAGLLKAANSFAEAIHSAVQSVSSMAGKIAPLLAVLKLLHSAFQGIMLLRFGQYLSNMAINSAAGRSFALGRAEASYGLKDEGGNAMYRMGQRFQNNMGGIMGRPIGETVSNVFSGARGLAAYAGAGLMNLNASMMRGDPSEVANRQATTRAFTENITRGRQGLAPLTTEQKLNREQMNERRVAAGMNPIGDKPNGPMVGAAEQFKGIGAALKQFGSEIKGAGKLASLMGVQAGTAGGELRIAFAGLSLATLRATGALTMMAVKAIGSLIASMGMQMGMMLAMMAAFQAFNSIKEGTSKAHALRDEGIKNGLEKPGSVYNDFAQKAGLATRNVDSLAKSAQNAAHQLVVNTQSMAEANDLTQARIAAARNPGYQQAWKFGEKKNAQQLANEIINLEGNTPNPQARAQLLNDLIKQYGAGTAQQVTNILAPESRGQRNGNNERQRTSGDVYVAGLNDVKDKREDKWWSSTYRFLSGSQDNLWSKGYSTFQTLGGNFIVGGNNSNWKQNNGQGKYDTEASRDAMSSLITNIASTAMNTGNIYGAKAGQLSQFAEISKLYNTGKNTGQFGDVAAVINGMYGTNYKGSDVGDYNTLSDLLKNTLKEGNDDQKALYEEMFGKKTKENPSGGYAVGQNLNDPNFMKVFMENAAKTLMVSLDEQFAKSHPESTGGLTKIAFAATDAAQRTGFKLEDMTSSSANTAARNAYLGIGKGKDAKNNLTKEERIAVDAANRPNDPVAQALRGTSLAIEAMDKNGQNYTDAMVALTNAMRSTESGTAEQAQYQRAIAQVKGIGNVMDAGLGSITIATRNVQVGKAAQAGPLPKNDEEQQQYDDKISAMQQGEATIIGFVKAAAEARYQLDIQTQRQNEQQQKAVMRSNRDFNYQMANQDEDYRTSVKRANEEFRIQRKRQSEDFAKSVYSPYQRITAVRTSDAYSLIGNLKNQNKVLKTQMSNVAKLKKMGLSQQSIDTLDLFNPANAQEVARLVMDFSSNKALIESTNKEVATRNRLATQHENSTLNQSTVRADQDFERRRTIAENDYNKSVRRAVHLHKQALHDMKIDLKDSQTYAMEDLANFGHEIDVTSSTIESTLEGVFKGMPAVAKTNISAALTAVQTAVKEFKPTTIHYSSDVDVPRISSYQKKSGKPTSPPVADSLYWQNTAEAGSWYQDPAYTEYYWKLGRGMKFDLNTGAVTLADINKNKWVGRNNGVFDYGAEGYALHKAAGGYITGPGTKTSDSIPAMLSHGEYVVKADAVSKYGAHFLDNINNLNFKSGSYVHGRESKMSAMQGYATAITHNTSTQYDHSTQINGPITVQSTDPNQFMRQMQAKKRLSRLNQPVGN